MPPVNEKIRRLEALQMMKEKVVDGKSTKEIAAARGCSDDKVQKTLSWGERAGLFINHQDQILQQLIPTAIKAVKEAMEDGDAQVALEVLKGQHFLTKPGQPMQHTGKKAGMVIEQHGPGNDMWSYISQQRQQAQLQWDIENGNLIEGEISERKQLTAGGSVQSESVESASVSELPEALQWSSLINQPASDESQGPTQASESASQDIISGELTHEGESGDKAQVE